MMLMAFGCLLPSYIFCSEVSAHIFHPFFHLGGLFSYDELWTYYGAGLVSATACKYFLLDCDLSFHSPNGVLQRNADAAKSLQSCLTLCDPIDGSPPGSPIPGILQARTLEWVAISFSKAWKWKVKVKSLSRVQLLVTPWVAAYQAPLSMDFPGKSTGVGCHFLLQQIFPTQGSNPDLPHCRQTLYCLS